MQWCDSLERRTPPHAEEVAGIRKDSLRALPPRTRRSGLRKNRAPENCREMHEVAGHNMNINSNKSLGWMVVLIVLGVAVFFGGTKWLTFVIPAALLVWFGARPTPRSGEIDSRRDN
jgi:hypothetical protein